MSLNLSIMIKISFEMIFHYLKSKKILIKFKESNFEFQKNLFYHMIKINLQKNQFNFMNKKLNRKLILQFKVVSVPNQNV